MLQLRLYHLGVLALAAGFAATAFAQNDALKKARQRMSDSLGSSQDFICAVTFERSAKTGTAAAAPQSPLKTEAGVINGKELYARPANESDEPALIDVLDQFSRAGTGAFGTVSRPLFLTNQATFYGAPEETASDRKRLRWEFTMPKEVSQYGLTAAGKRTIVGYSGVFAADAESGDIVHLELHPDGLPADSGLKDVAQTIEYGRGTINGVSVILPSSSSLALQETGGRELRVKASFENCRLYTTKSGIHFVQGVTTISSAAGPATVAGPRLPARTSLDLTLEEAIDEKTAAPGMKIVFKVAKDVKSEGQVLVQKGAPVSAHVTRVSRQSYRAMDSWKGYYIVGIQLDSVEGAGTTYSLAANLETVGPATTIETFLPYSQAPDKWGAFVEVRDQLTFPPRQPGESILGVVREYLRVPGRLRFVFSTGG